MLYSLRYIRRVARRYTLKKAPQVIVWTTESAVGIVTKEVIRELVEKP